MRFTVFFFTRRKRKPTPSRQPTADSRMKVRSGKVYLVTGRSKMGANVHTDPKQDEFDAGEFPTIDAAQEHIRDCGRKDHIYFVWVLNPLEKLGKTFVEKWAWRNDVRRNDGLAEYFDKRWHRIWGSPP